MAETHRRVFGPARDFYRERFAVMAEENVSELEWRDDVLWREERWSAPSPTAKYVIEAVSVDDGTVRFHRDFSDRGEASDFAVDFSEALDSMTKMEFETAYSEGWIPS